MITLQIVERPGVGLYRALVHAVRTGDLRTFQVARRGKRLTHRNPTYTGRIDWSNAAGVISCEIVSPRAPGSEWRLLSALVGRLADRFAENVHSLSIQFPESRPVRRKKRPKRRRSR